MDAAVFDRHFASTHGVFTPAMASQLSVTPREVARLRAGGTLVRVAGLGMVSAQTEITPVHRAMAGQLTWPNSISAFRSAGLIHEFKLDDDGKSHLLVPNGRRPTNGLVPHNWSVHPTEVEHRGLLRVTDRQTSLADCLGRLPEGEAWGLLAWHWSRDEITEEDLSAQIDERRNLYGVVRLRAMLAAVRDGALSIGEVRFHEFLRDANIIGWEGDQKIYRGTTIVARADVLFRSLRLIFEFDGAVAHNEDTAEYDAAREQRLKELGFTVVHVTWAQMYERPTELRRTLRAAIRDADTGRAA